MKNGMQKAVIQVISFFIFAIVFVSCERGDDVPPQIEFYKPYENAFYSVFDTIEIKAKVWDDVNLETIDIYLTNDAGTPVLKNYSIPVHSNPQEISFPYPINDNYLHSGNYNISIRAFDGTMQRNSGVLVRIIGVPREYQGLGVVTKNGNMLDVIQVDTAWNIHKLYSVNSDFSGSAYLTYHNRFITTSYLNGKAFVYDFFSTKKVWEVDPVVMPPVPGFTGAFASDKSIVLMYYSDNKIEQYNYDGKKEKVVYGATGYYTDEIISVMDDYVIYSVMKNNPAYGMINFIKGVTWATLQTYTIDFVVKGMFYVGDNNVLLICNKGNEAFIKLYNIDLNSFTKLRDLSPGIIKSAAALPGKKFAFVQNNELVLYDYNTNYTVSKLQSVNFDIMKYDNVSSLLYVKSGNTCSSYSYPDFLKLNSVTLSDTVLDFQIIYNF